MFLQSLPGIPLPVPQFLLHWLSISSVNGSIFSVLFLATVHCSLISLMLYRLLFVALWVWNYFTWAKFIFTPWEMEISVPDSTADLHSYILLPGMLWLVQLNMPVLSRLVLMMVWFLMILQTLQWSRLHRCARRRWE